MHSWRLLTMACLLWLGCRTDADADLDVRFNAGMGCTGGDGPLLLTRFESLEAFKAAVEIRYSGHRRAVTLTHRCGALEVTSVLRQGIKERDFVRARDGHVMDKVRVLVMSPFVLLHRRDLVRVEILGRRRPYMFGPDDVAFFDVAEAMRDHLVPGDSTGFPAADLDEKGYLNTFNHVMAQAFITAVFSERLADYVADVHERDRMPELVTGELTEAQVADVLNGATDNYLDMINNEWGQELGKALRRAFRINRHTRWSPDLMADVLNAGQQYHSWAMQVSFMPFRSSDEIVIRLADKFNAVLNDLDGLTAYYAIK